MEKIIAKFGVLAFLVCSSCVLPEEDLDAASASDEDLGQTSAALVIGSGSSQPSAMCEGYTSGGGQRVRGRARIERMVSPASGGGYHLKYRISVSAENWKKNFGWNKKRTTQLAIQGVINNVPCYGFTPSCMGYLAVDLGTGGNLMDEIGYAWESETIGPINDPGFYDFEADFQLNYYGRDGTHCDLDP